MSAAFATAFLFFAATARSAPVHVAGFEHLWPSGGLPVLWFMVRDARVRSVDTALLAIVALAGNLLNGAGLTLAAVFAGAAVVQTWCAVLGLRRLTPETWGCGGERPPDRPRTAAVLGGVLVAAMAAGAVLGTLVALAVPGALEGFDAVATGLYFGRNLGSALIVVPVGVLVGQRLTSARPRPPLLGTDGGLTELVAATLVTVAMYGLAFRLDALPLAFPLLAATVWFAARFSTIVSCAHTFVVGLATMLLTVNGIGPFAEVTQVDVGSMIAQFYVATIAITGLAIATGRDERQTLADELRRTREEAVYQEQVRSAVIHSMTEGVLVVDEAGELLVHNEAAARLLSDGTELTSDSRRALSSWTVDGVELEAAQRPTERALRGERVEDELLVVRAGGAEERILTVSAVPLPRDEVRHRARALLLMRDTTTEHAHREELAAFAGVVAHDLRNPLAAIDGWTEMMADELDSGGLDAQVAREFVTRVRSSSHRMRELIRDLLAHATSSARDLDVVQVDVAALVEEIVAARHAEGFVSVTAIPPVLADRVLVRQVLDNLIGNALKYVAPGQEPKIVVHGCRTGARSVAVHVDDNGIGIPEEHRERVFEEFHRAHYRDYEGSGLGLSIVRRIVNRHGGTIEARPRPGEPGTSFVFTLPAYAA